jgi:hypothetical protein
MAGAAKAQKLAGLMGSSLAMIGSVDAYTYDEAKGEAEITVTLQIVNIGTGKLESTVTATGRGARAQDQTDQTEAGIGLAAAYDAAEKLLVDVASASPTELSDDTASDVQVVEQPARSKKSKWFLPALVGAMVVGFLISGG